MKLGSFGRVRQSGLAVLLLAASVACASPTPVSGGLAARDAAAPVGEPTPAPSPDEDAVAASTIPQCTGRNVAAFVATDFEALGLPRPVAARAATVAPNLRNVQQLIVVPGIGPGQLTKILAANPDLCATPPVVPPPTLDACVSTVQFDVNDLDQPEERARLAKKTVLSPREVEVMSTKGPFATVDVATSVLGIGAGTTKKLQATVPPTLCATPPGFVTADGTTYGWISSYLNDEVAADGFALNVAKGTLTSTTGAWTYIDRQDIDLGDPDVPPIAAADVHLDDDEWQGSGRPVWVSVPPDTSPTVPTVELEQKVFHERSDGKTDVYDAAQTFRDGDRVTVQATSTSIFGSVVGFVWESWRWLRGRSVGSPSCSQYTPAPAGSAHVGSMLSNGNGGLIGECMYGNSNVPGAVGAIDRVRGEITVDYTSLDRVQISGPGFGEDLLSSLVAKAWTGMSGRAVASFGSNTNLYLPPAAPYWSGGTFVAPPSVGHYRIDPNVAATGFGVLLDKTFGLVLDGVVKFLKSHLPPGIDPAVVTDITGSAIGEFIDCGMDLYRGHDVFQVGDVYSFLKTCLKPVFDSVVVRLTLEIDNALGLDVVREKNTLLRLGFNVKVGDLTNIAIDVIYSKQFEVLSQIATTLTDLARALPANRTATLSAPAVRPTKLDTGQSIPGSCITGDGTSGYRVERSCVVPPNPPSGTSTYIAKAEDSRLAIVVRDGRKIGEFAGGGDYICAVQSLPVRWVKNASFLEAYGESSASLSCPGDVGGGPKRNIGAVDNVLLRMSDGTTYYKNSSTLVGIEHVLDGGCFEQLAAGHFGYDYVTADEVASALKDGWEIDDASAACG